MIDDGRQAFVDGAYLIASICFIIGLKRLSSPATARRGNQLAAIGMLIAVVATFFIPDLDSSNMILIAVGLVVGTVGGYFAAKRVKMTEMPQMVAIFNGMGGITAAFVSVAEFMHKDSIPGGEVVSIVLGTVIGSISLTGSVIAYLKLQELMSGRPITFPNQQLYNAGLAAAMIVLGIAVVVLGDGSAGNVLLWLTFIAA